MTQLNGLGLYHKVKHLMEHLKARGPLQDELNKATDAVNKNTDAIKQIKVELGEQAKHNGGPLIITVDDYAAYVPLPKVGYTDDPVDVHFSKPKGLNNL